MGVHDGICQKVSQYLGTKQRIHTGINSLVIERHVLLVHNQPTYALLSMPRRELVSQFRSTSLPNKHLDKCLVVLRVTDHDFVDVARDGGLVAHWCVLIGYSGGMSSKRIVRCVCWRLLVHVYVAWIDSFADASQSIALDDVVLLQCAPRLVRHRVR